MTARIDGTIEAEGGIANIILGLINVVGIFINEIAPDGKLLHVIFNPGPTIEFTQVNNAARIPQGEAYRNFSGTIKKNGTINKIEGVIAQNGIFMTVSDNSGNPEYALWNPGETEEIDWRLYYEENRG